MADKYDFTPEARAEILAALKQRADVIQCSVCHKEQFTITEGFVALRILNNFWLNHSAGTSLVFAALVCDICGNTLLFNLGQLGLEHLVSPDLEELKRRGLAR